MSYNSKCLGSEADSEAKKRLKKYANHGGMQTSRRLELLTMGRKYSLSTIL